MGSTPIKAGDRVHVPALGTGTVREVRNGGRCVVELKGRAVVVALRDLERAEPGRARHVEPPPSLDAPSPPLTPLSLDLHGKTVPEAMDALDLFLNDALLSGAPVVHVIHGRSGGRIKSAVHQRLKQLPSIRAFGLDPLNQGITVVKL